MHPNYEGMPDAEKEHAKDEYERKRKAFTDQRQAKHLKDTQLVSTLPSEPWQKLRSQGLKSFIPSLIRIYSNLGLPRKLIVMVS